MANEEHLAILNQGVVTWNQWRKEHPEVAPDLGSADLSLKNLEEAILVEANLTNAKLEQASLKGVDLRKAALDGANFSGADLRGADLRGADPQRRLDQWYDEEWYEQCFASHIRPGMIKITAIEASQANMYHVDTTFAYANLTNADLSDAHLAGVNFFEANLTNAKLARANLSFARLSFAHLSGADLSGANLYNALLVEADLTGATLTQCYIYGISAWGVQLKGAKQNNLTITPRDQPTITVDNLKIAQFIYLLLNNAEIRDVIDTLTTKSVLILGRFTPERKAILDAIRDELRKHNYLPLLFDFDQPLSRDITETVTTLAHLARFIVADLSEPSSIPKELEAIVPTIAVPVQPLLEGSTRPYAMFKDYWKYQWVLEVYRYNGLEELLASLTEHVIEPAERKAKELAKLRVQAFEEQ